MDNIVNLNSKYNQQAEDCEHEEVCEHCSWLDKTADNFISKVEGLEINSDEYIEAVLDLIGYVEYITHKETLSNVAHSLLDVVYED